MLTLAQFEWKFNAWVNQTTVHPLGLSVLILLCVAVLVSSRPIAIASFFLLGFFVSPNQRIVVVGLDFDFTRVLILSGILRVVVRNEAIGFRLRKQDVLIIAFTVTSVLATSIRTSGEGLTNRLGFSLDVLGQYFMFRCLIRSQEDLLKVLRYLAIGVIPVGCFFLLEKTSGKNLFSIFGGVSEQTIIRNGRLRCQGAFAHPIIAGVYFASWIPLFFGAYLAGFKQRGWYLLAIAIAVFIIFATSSSTPVSALILGAIGWLSFGMRKHLKLIRWVGLVALVCLHFAMENGVWHLFARVDLVGGSTGWHRYSLIDRSIAHLDEWYLIGLDSTSHWGEGLHDVTNEYILTGLRGGLLGMAILIAMLVVAFTSIGDLLRNSKSGVNQYFAFGFGVSLFIHACVFLSLSYFGQSVILWYFTLASIESIAQFAADPVAKLGMVKSPLLSPKSFRARL